MLRSLFTGITGLQAHQQMLDITANNIANVNTVGFKDSRPSSRTPSRQTLLRLDATRRAASTRSQIGLGVQAGRHRAELHPGLAAGHRRPEQRHDPGRRLLRRDQERPAMYTRAGAFSIDNSGNLATPDGAAVLDVTGGADQPVGADRDQLGLHLLRDHLGRHHQRHRRLGGTTALGQIGVATFANPNGLEKVGDSEYIATAGSGAAQIGAAVRRAAAGRSTSGYLESRTSTCPPS